ncbi:MAG: hypothetical protein GXO54_07625 [Chloroflexi bacterium]|nr:hypothetical protein [Chloroflexota bacterium]
MDARVMTSLFLLLLGGLAGLLLDGVATVILRATWQGLTHCERCGARLGWTARWRRCPHCGHWPRRPWVMAGLLALVSAGLPWLGRWPVLALWPVTACFFLHAVIDWEDRLVYTPLVSVAILICGAIGVWMHGLASTLLGLLIGAGGMGVLYGLGVLFVRWRGLGDVWLGGLVGVVLGWPGVIAGLTLGTMLAGLYALGVVLYYALRHRQWVGEQPIPYGPFLLLGAWLLLLGQGS